MRGEHGERVCPDLVRRVPVRGDPVGAGDDEIDLAISEPAAESAMPVWRMPARSAPTR